MHLVLRCQAEKLLDLFPALRSAGPISKALSWQHTVQQPWQELASMW